PERAIGLAAHDFAQSAACAEVFLTRALKAEGTPTVASRWVQRLVQLTKGLKVSKDKSLYNNMVAQKDLYAGMARALATPPPALRIAPPYPRPPVSARPRRLSVTQIENWIRDPYAIYARYVLGLRRLEPLEAEIGPLERGNTLHRILEIFVRD